MENNIAYIAGLFDGEGSITYKQYMRKRKHQKKAYPTWSIRMEISMTDMSKYKNVSLTKETYRVLEALSKILLPDAKLSVSKTIEAIANEKAKKLNGKIKT